MTNDQQQKPTKKPIEDCFPVSERLYVGEYPCAKDDDEKAISARLENFAHFGITHFIDLTMEGEAPSYDHLLPSGQKHLRFPIQARTAPSTTDTENVIRTIREILQEDPKNIIYLHCWYGVGRVGAIIGCMLAEESNNNYPQVIKQLVDLLSNCPRGEYWHIPAEPEQGELIRQHIKARDAKRFEEDCNYEIPRAINANNVDIEEMLECFQTEQEVYDSVLMFPNDISLFNEHRCLDCGGQLIQMYYRSCAESWIFLAGREGELRICKKCLKSDDFRCTLMN